jgi:hypothetical protein
MVPESVVRGKGHDGCVDVFAFLEQNARTGRLLPARRRAPNDVGARSASLKEWGRVNEVVGFTCRFVGDGACVGAGVVGGAGVKAGRRPPRGLGLDAGERRRRLEFRPCRSTRRSGWSWGWGVAPWSSRSEVGSAARLPRHPFADRVVEHGAFRPRPDGLQAVRRPRRPRWGSCRSRARVRSCPSLTPLRPGRGSGSRRRAGRSRRA